MDRLGGSIQDLIAIVAGLRKRGVGFASLHETLDTTTPGGHPVFHVRGPGGVHPRTHRAGHQRGPGRRPRPRRPARPPAGDDGGAGTSRPRPACNDGLHQQVLR
ncbi:recombinase family protein [Streptomyces sp. DSM 41033]|uniref:recombinase family protein n=1 Tax=Streptomyces sp. DSM 41033 TaxID=3448655 RepID=UPI00403FD10B